MGLAAGQTYHSNGSATTAPFSYSGVLHIQICTRIYIVDLSTGKVLRSVALYWRPFFCGSWRKKATKRTPNIAQVDVCRRSKHHAVFIGCQKQRFPHYCLRQGTGATLILENAPYLLQRVQFVASRLKIFTALPTTMDRSNAKLGEGVKRIF